MTRLQFTGLVIENFGPFKGTQTVDFVDADGVTIIWGNNGRGKTTLLNIIRYALFGKYQNRRGADVDLPSLANLEGKKDGKYDFKVILKMINDGIRYELTRQYVVRKGIFNPQKNDDYEEHVFLKKEGAILSPNQREHELNLIMPNEVSRFFLFDGELLQEYEELLMEGTQTGNTIKESIEQILGVPVLTNGAIDTEATLDEYRKEKNKTAQSNAQTQKIAAQMTALEAEKQEHTAEMTRLRQTLNIELGNKTRFEDEAQQSEHVSTLIKSLEALDRDVEAKTARRDDILANIVLATGEAWKGLVSSRVEIILSEVDKEIKRLEERESAHKVANHFMREMKNAAMKHHCDLCDQDIPDDKIETLVQRITVASNEFGGLTEDEAKVLQSLRVRKGTLQSIKAESKKDVLELLETQLANLEVEIDDATRQRKTVREELERHGDIEELSKDTKDKQANIRKTTVYSVDGGRKMVLTILRILILYVLATAAVRIMGKRQIGELQPSELVITILLSEIAAIPMQDTDIPLLNSVVAVLLLVAFEIISSVISMKSRGARRLLEGNAVTVIRDGRIDQKEIKRLRYTVDDLLTALRQKDVFDISTVGYAVLETNGKLSVMLKPDENALTAKTLRLSLPVPGMPCLVISDGKVIREHYDDCNMNDRELKRLLRAKGLEVEDVLIMTVDRDRNAVIVEKEKKI